MACEYARRADKYHGWKCEIAGGECMFLVPDRKACAEIYGEGPDAKSADYPEIYAVDFDKTLNLAEKYPDLGKPNTELIEILKEKQAAGDKIILWTCREGELLERAVEYCRKYGLEFDAINDNTEENKEKWGNNCRKVFANYYIDDKSMTPEYAEFRELVKKALKD